MSIDLNLFVNLLLFIAVIWPPKLCYSLHVNCLWTVEVYPEVLSLGGGDLYFSRVVRCLLVL